jgi:CBS domain-containing protein
MSSKKMLPELQVKEVMRSPVYTIRKNETVDRAARLMAEHEVGSLIVLNSEGKPVGIITERDLVRRVIMGNLLPSTVKVGQIMSRPLVTVPSSISVSEAAKQMGKLGIKKLVIVERGQPIGIVSSREIIQATPPLMDLILEKSRTGLALTASSKPLSGYCETCGEWADLLVEVNGSFVCEECAADIAAPGEA